MIVGVTVLIVTPLTALATHSFTDVPNTNTFHEDIEWLKDSGVTKGCNPPANTEYCPDDNVTRGQMAAFMKRFAGYLQAEDGIPAQADHSISSDNADTVDGKHASAFALRSDLPTDGSLSCPGVAFYPISDGFDWRGVETRTSSEAFLIEATCPLELPDGVPITRFVASFEDGAVSDSNCILKQMDVTGDRFGLGMGNVEFVAQTSVTSGSTGANQTVSTTDISHAVTDTNRYAYWASCAIGENSDLGINGVVVEYTLP